MSRKDQIAGFDYVAGKEVSMTRAEWRAKYPTPKYTRNTSIPGETAYFLECNGRPRVAEAYATISEART